MVDLVESLSRLRLPPSAVLVVGVGHVGISRVGTPTRPAAPSSPDDFRGLLSVAAVRIELLSRAAIVGPALAGLARGGLPDAPLGYGRSHR